MKYKIKDSRLIYKSEYLELYDDLVKINNNTEIEEQEGQQENGELRKQLSDNNNPMMFQRIKITHDSTIIVPVFSDGSLLMIEVYRYGVDEVLLEFPGGTIEEKEYGEHELRKTARNELLEETGDGCKVLEYKGWFYTWASKMNQKIHVFLAKELEKVSEQKLEKTEDIKIKIVPKNVVIDKFFKKQEIKNAKTVTAFVYAFMPFII
jgi:ADP-ribose pyrophosphatase